MDLTNKRTTYSASDEFLAAMLLSNMAYTDDDMPDITFVEVLVL